MLDHLDLFSGIGGFSLGLERTGGFKTVAFCEIDPFCQKVLKKHWPEVKQYHDITNAKFTENVGLVTAGFPCQDISYAGEGAGITGERSGLFWYIIRTLCMVGRPKLLLENVAGLLNRGLCTVLGALASFGYDAEWHCIPASAVGAPHIRDRIWIIANANEFNDVGSGYGAGKRCGEQPPPAGVQRRDNVADSDSGNKYGRCRTLQMGGIWSQEKIKIDDIKRGIKWSPEPDVGRVAYGVSDRVDKLRGLGNAVVPQIPEIIGYAILEAEK